jgi:succinyl-CoA synthetase beta subunit
MNLHEYQAKEIMASRGIKTPKGQVCYDPLEALVVARKLNCEKVVLKAQAHTGGRGKAGGIAVVPVDDKLRIKAREILNMTLVTNQTGPAGKPVSALLVEEAPRIDNELYLGVVLDRNLGKVTIMASSAGGVDIEEVAAKTPEKIITVPVDPILGLQPYQARSTAYRLLEGAGPVKEMTKVIRALYRTFVDLDCSLAEINPLVVSGDEVLALDAKINLDENALFRHPELELYRDRTQEDPVEMSAKKDGLSYIKLNGNIGCIVNGAGLAMATLDLISHHGGTPANFLDVGGGASEQVVCDAMLILLEDDNVELVFINIFGGILRCDVLAKGVIKALRLQEKALPVVARIEGTNIEEGRRLFKESGLPIEMIDSLDDAAGLVVKKSETAAG